MSRNDWMEYHTVTSSFVDVIGQLDTLTKHRVESGDDLKLKLFPGVLYCLTMFGPCLPGLQLLPRPSCTAVQLARFNRRGWQCRPGRGRGSITTCSRFGAGGFSCGTWHRATEPTKAFKRDLFLAMQTVHTLH